MKLSQKNLIAREVDYNQLPSEQCEPFSKYSLPLKSQVFLSPAALVQAVVQITLKSLLCFPWYFYYLCFVDTKVKQSDFEFNSIMSISFFQIITELTGINNLANI